MSISTRAVRTLGTACHADVVAARYLARKSNANLVAAFRGKPAKRVSIMSMLFSFFF